MKVRYAFIARLSKDLYAKNGDLYGPHLDIDTLLIRLNIQKEEKILDENISGAAIINGGKRRILINISEPDNRRRFTACHEIAHCLAHSDQALSVDVQSITLLRDPNSSNGENWREVEANRLAAALLMPEELLHTEFALSKEFYSTDSLVVQDLAHKFQVSEQAMLIRLGSIGY